MLYFKLIETILFRLVYQGNCISFLFGGVGDFRPGGSLKLCKNVIRVMP